MVFGHPKKNLSCWKKSPPPPRLGSLEITKGPATSMPLTCKSTNTEPYLLCLVPTSQETIFLCLHHPYWAKAMEIIQMSCSPSLAFPSEIPMKASPKTSLTPVFCPLTTCCPFLVAPSGERWLLSLAPMSIINFTSLSLSSASPCDHTWPFHQRIHVRSPTSFKSPDESPLPLECHIPHV